MYCLIYIMSFPWRDQVSLFGRRGNLSWVIKNGRWEAIFWGSRVSLRGSWDSILKRVPASKSITEQPLGCHIFSFLVRRRWGGEVGVASERTEACSADEDFSFVHLHFIACA
jgi:hypothetical protein